MYLVISLFYFISMLIIMCPMRKNEMAKDIIFVLFILLLIEFVIYRIILLPL